MFLWGSAFVNPDFEEVKTGVDNTVYGWIVDKSPIVNTINLNQTLYLDQNLKVSMFILLKRFKLI